VLFGVGDTWIFHGRTWVDVFGDELMEAPGPRADHAMVLAAEGARGLLLGGMGNTGDTDRGTWGWAFPDRPAHSVLFDTSTLGCASPGNTDVAGVRALTLTGATVMAVAGGGVTPPGAELWVWQGQGWQLQAANDAAFASPGRLQWSATDAQMRRALIAGQSIGLQLRPRAHSAPAPARLATDLVELTVQYQLSEPGATEPEAPLCPVVPQ
jgi:hypothetical protein